MKNKIPFNCRRIVHIMFMLLLSHSTFSQVTVDLRNKTIREALKEIENESSFRFFYNNDLEGLDKVISLKISDGEIDTTLEALFAESEIAYQKQDNNIILLIPRKIASEKKDKKKITGIVKDMKGEAIIGASVKVKGASFSLLFMTERSSLQI